jgi:hypothetical protein
MARCRRTGRPSTTNVTSASDPTPPPPPPPPAALPPPPPPPPAALPPDPPRLTLRTGGVTMSPAPALPPMGGPMSATPAAGVPTLSPPPGQGYPHATHPPPRVHAYVRDEEARAHRNCPHIATALTSQLHSHRNCTHIATALTPRMPHPCPPTHHPPPPPPFPSDARVARALSKVPSSHRHCHRPGWRTRRRAGPPGQG